MLDITKNYLTLLVIFPIIILFTGYLSYKLKFIQITKIFTAVKLLSTKEKSGAISSFGALSAILGGNLGTGNISGVAIALTTGGPGALFWMWVIALFASITKYAGCFLGVHFQKQDLHQQWVGGPMYYLRDGLNNPFLAKLFCVLTLISALTVGNLVQVHALTLPLIDLNISPLIPSLFLAFLVAGVIFGGLKYFSHLVSILVPFMAISYILSCIIILFFMRDNILFYIKLIFISAFDFQPLLGGSLGFGILHSIRAGFNRGLFATDSGLGLAPIMHSSVRDTNKKYDNRVTQGIISMLSPLIVMIICSLTGLVLLTTQVTKLSHLESTRLCMAAFRTGFGFELAGHIVSITLFFFAFTTILTWCFCAERALNFFTSNLNIIIFKIIFILIIPLGTIIQASYLWNLADISINLMFIINIWGLFKLRKIYLNTN